MTAEAQVDEQTPRYVHKCYFRPEALLAELGGGEVCFEGETFVAGRRVWSAG